MSITEQPAIDVHGHWGLYDAGPNEHINRFMTGGKEVVLERAARARTVLTVVSPLKAFYTHGPDDIVDGNEETARMVAKTRGLLQWAVVDPLDPRTYEQAARLLALPNCVGIKIHPELHGYPIQERGHEIFRFAAEHGAVVISHSGEKLSMPEHFVPFADDYAESVLILAHLGCGWDEDPSHQVRAAVASRKGNIHVDTSSAKSITPGLLEWAVSELGPERILYGTDSPLYFAPMQRARIDHADLPDGHKHRILHDNAARLLGLPSAGEEEDR